MCSKRSELDSKTNLFNWTHFKIWVGGSKSILAKTGLKSWFHRHSYKFSTIFLNRPFLLSTCYPRHYSQATAYEIMQTSLGNSIWPENKSVENNSTGQELAVDIIAKTAWPDTPTERNRCNNVVINEQIIFDCAFQIQELSSKQMVPIQSKQKEPFYLLFLEENSFIRLKIRGVYLHLVF